MQKRKADHSNVVKTFHKIILVLGVALLGAGLVFLCLLLFALKDNEFPYFIFFTVFCFIIGLIYLILGAVSISKDIKSVKRRTDG